MEQLPRNPSEMKKTGLILLLTVALFLLLTAVTGLVAVLLNMEDLLQRMALSTLFVELLAIYVPAWLYMQKHGGTGRFFGQRISFLEALWSAFLGLGLFFFFTGLNSVWTMLMEWLHIPMVGSELPTDLGWRFAAAVVLVAVIPALCEEQLFRGLLLRSWTRNAGEMDAKTWKTGGWRRGLIHTALLFALLHLQLSSLPVLFGLGLCLGQIARLCRSAHASMWAHGIYNLMALMFTVAAGEVGADEVAEGLAFSTTEILASVGFYLLLGAVCLFGGWRMLKRCAAHSRERASRQPEPGGWGETSLARWRPDPASGEENALTVEKGGHPGEWRTVLIICYAVLLVVNAAVMVVL